MTKSVRWAAQAAYVTYYPDILLPGALDRVTAFVSLALNHDLFRLGLLTGRGEGEAQRAEDMLMSSGADWTVVRASWFMQNFSENFFVDSIRAGEVAFPSDRITEPFVDAEDIADIVAKALIEDGHGGKLYEVTGPRLLIFGQAVAEIGRAVDREIRYVPVAVDDYLESLRELDGPLIMSSCSNTSPARFSTDATKATKAGPTACVRRSAGRLAIFPSMRAAPPRQVSGTEKDEGQDHNWGGVRASRLAPGAGGGMAEITPEQTLRCFAHEWCRTRRSTHLWPRCC